MILNYSKGQISHAKYIGAKSLFQPIFNLFTILHNFIMEKTPINFGIDQSNLIRVISYSLLLLKL